MKKIALLVVLFLVGAATETKANQLNSVENKPVNDCNHADKIQFVEDHVIYTIAADGSFTFDILDNPKYYKEKEHKNKHGKPKNHKKQHSHYNPKIVTDRYGRIRAINKTYISYYHNGKVHTIGDVPMRYYRGDLVQVGDMELVYNRFGEVRSTIGHVNKENKKFWHEGWYVYNDRDGKRFNDENIGRRIRTQ
ncbi:hypothetical protein [Rasiella sp. SM2506]|uniref:hypothetical protein n=1 Tax=Rasiella sp. SM2506 TaxID=3423914 RepID=UPI003D7AA5D4